MGYIKHHTIIVTSWNREHISKTIEEAKKIFSSYEKGAEKLISEPIEYIVNDGLSFFIAPDGSKEGWAVSENLDKARKDFLDWLAKSDFYCDYVEVAFGGDDDNDRITERAN